MTNDSTSYELLFIVFAAIYMCGMIVSQALYFVLSNNSVSDVHQWTIIAISGFGNVFAGLLLFNVQHWTSFKQIDGLMVLVPSLMGLKGNLEMTMAARLSTRANLNNGGEMNSWKNIFHIIKSDIILVQCQATVVSFLAAIMAIANGFIYNITFKFNNMILLCAISISTANIACFLLGMLMAAIIVWAHKLDWDPDDFATPIAASLGDLTTLLILAYCSEFTYNLRDINETPIESIMLIAFFVIIEPFLILMSYNNEYTRDIVVHGWTPIVLAMIISSLGGFILESSANKYERFATYQPVFNGFCGNCAALQASKHSTALHRIGSIGTVNEDFKTCVSPFHVFCSNENQLKTIQKLLFVVMPSQLMYILLIRIIQGRNQFEMTLPFIAFYLMFAFIAVAILLYIAYNLVHWVWRLKCDPDNNAIPLLTAMGDFLGTFLLFIEFTLLYELKDPNATNKTDQ